MSVVTRAPDTDYERIFHPKRVAIAGVSPGGGSGFGTLSLLSLQAMGFEGELFPVNPKGGEITGLKIYRRVEDIPGKLDLVVVVVEVHAKARQTFLAKGIPVFDEIGDALRAIANVNRYYEKGETA